MKHLQPAAEFSYMFRATRKYRCINDWQYPCYLISHNVLVEGFVVAWTKTKTTICFFENIAYMYRRPPLRGPFKSYITLFSGNLTPTPTPRNANNVEPYIFVTLFSGKSDTPHPLLRYVTLEGPLPRGKDTILTAISCRKSESYV